MGGYSGRWPAASTFESSSRGAVGWVERKRYPSTPLRMVMGFAALYPSYEKHTSAFPRRVSPGLAGPFRGLLPVASSS